MQSAMASTKQPILKKKNRCVKRFRHFHCLFDFDLLGYDYELTKEVYAGIYIGSLSMSRERLRA